MEDQHGFKRESYGIMVVYHPFRNYETKEFSVSMEIRDYHRRYCVMVPLAEEMFLDLLKQYTELKDAGFTYKSETKFKKGVDER